MKAIIYTKYGSPDNLQLQEVENPHPKNNEVLIKVHAASVNSWDWELLKGEPFITRLESPLKPKYPILGCDVAGKIEAIGSNVERLKIGDEVFGDLSGCGFGCFAEYVCANEDMLALKTAELSFEEAAAIPQAGVEALQAIRLFGELKPGHAVLINGSGGGVGTFAIQLAKSSGAEVTGVDTSDKFDLMKSIGADHVIDYKKNDYTELGLKYDLIIDNVAYHTISDYKKILKPDGICVIVGGSVPRILYILIKQQLFNSKTGKRVNVLLHKPNRDDLNTLTKYFLEKKFRPIIDKTFTIDKTHQALRLIGEGKVNGKVIIKM